MKVKIWKKKYSVLTYRVDLYFHDYKLAIEVDEKGHKDRNEDYEKQIQKEIETELSCRFVRINHDEENFNISKFNSKIFTSIKNSLKKLSEESTKNTTVEDLEKTTKIVKQLRI